MERKYKIVCLKQILVTRAERMQGVHFIQDYIPEGHGDCSVCQTSPDNRFCSGYVPVKVFSYEVIGRDDD